MKFENVKKLSDAQFRRASGVKRETFKRMLEVLKEAEGRKKARGGRPNSLVLSDRLLMTLEYLREYRTYLHIAASYGVSESSVFNTVKWIENTLIQCKDFRLPGKKALLKSDHEFEVILIDATETPIERPRKNNVNSIQVRKNVTQSKHRSS